eukprot:13827708-Alexandrium_andersonii.AAC.1
MAAAGCQAVAAVAVRPLRRCERQCRPALEARGLRAPDQDFAMPTLARLETTVRVPLSRGQRVRGRQKRSDQERGDQ